jgi:hypothetical protein
MALSWDVVALLNPVPVFKTFRTKELWVGGFLFFKIRIQKIIRLDYFLLLEERIF